MKKLLIFIYGTMAYIVFLFTFLYAIGFVGNILVPKTIDSGIESPFWEAIMINAVLLSVFAIQHRFMACPTFKEKWTRIIPKAMEVRHPIMLGFLIAFWATPVMTVGHLLFAITTTLYIYVAVKYLEEKDLRKFIGAEYDAYQKKVLMFIPFTKKKTKKSLTQTI